MRLIVAGRRLLAVLAFLAALPVHAGVWAGDYAVGDTVCAFFNTYQPSTGASFTIVSEAVDVYKENSGTQDTDDSGLTLDDDFDGVTGFHQICVDTSSDGTFYSAGSNFTVVLTAGTVDSVSVAGTAILTFGLNQTNVAAVTTGAIANGDFATTPGAAGGLLIAGTNADFDVTANASFAGGVTITQSTSNTAALVVTGNGTGNGATITSGSGATGTGLAVLSAATNGAGATITGAGTGNGATFTSGSGATGNGLAATAASTNGSGAVLTGTGTGNGLGGVGGSTSGEGINLTGGGTGDGFQITSGSGATGTALALIAASTNGTALTSTGTGTGNGATFLSGTGATGSGIVTQAQSTAGNGLQITGTGTSSGLLSSGGSTSGPGMRLAGGGTGDGLLATSGSGATGNGITATASSTNGNGFATAGVGTGAGHLTTGGATGHGMSAVGGATSGNGLRATGTAGNSAAINAIGQGSAAGFLTTGGATGAGLSAVGGATSGAGLSAAGTAGNSSAMALAGQGSAAGLAATGGATGAGMLLTGGATSGMGLATSITLPSGSALELGITTTGTLSGTHSSTNADLGGAAPVNDLSGYTLTVPSRNFSRAITSYDTGTGVATFASTGVTLTNGDNWYLFETAPASSSGGSGGSTASEIADAVWDEATSGHTSSGSFGQQVKTDIDDILVDTAEIGTAGAGLTNIDLPNQTMNIVGSITGSLSGSVASVTGAVGSVTGNVGGNVVGSVASVTGNVAGNVTGSVGSIGSGGLTAGSIASGAFTGAKFATSAGAALIDVPWNASWDAEVQSEVDDALRALSLQYLFTTAYDPTAKPGNALGLWNALIESDGGISRYTSEALEQAPSGSGASVDAIADEVETRTIAAVTSVNGFSAGAITGTALDATAVQKIWDQVIDGTVDAEEALCYMLAVIVNKSDYDDASQVQFKDTTGSSTKVTVTINGSDRETVTLGSCGN